jgi:hypothetical protein
MRRSLALLLGLGLTLAAIVPLSALAFAQLTVSTSTATGFTSATVHPPDGNDPGVVTCSVTSGPIRYRTDGGSPTSTVGTWMATSSLLTLSQGDLIANFKAIGLGSGSAVLDCNFWR